jgi:hypothetical protein
MSHSQIVESALQPINEELECVVVHGKQQQQQQQSPADTEKSILRILTLMASIRTRALEHGWGGECDRDLGEAQEILQFIIIQKNTATSTI